MENYVVQLCALCNDFHEQLLSSSSSSSLSLSFCCRFFFISVVVRRRCFVAENFAVEFVLYANSFFSSHSFRFVEREKMESHAIPLPWIMVDMAKGVYFVKNVDFKSETLFLQYFSGLRFKRGNIVYFFKRNALRQYLTSVMADSYIETNKQKMNSATNNRCSLT